MSRNISDKELDEVIFDAVCTLSKQIYIELRDKLHLCKDLFNSIRGLDIIQELIEDKSITEIMINGFESVFIEREGSLYDSELRFDSQRRLEDVIQKIAADSNRIVNESSPIVDCRLGDGSRVNIVLPPIALNGPIVTIRKFPEETMTMEKLIELGSVTAEAAELLQRLVVSGYNIFISGGTGSGKTTFLNALSNYIPHNERIITIEDSAELQIRGVDNLVSLEVRNANVEGRNAISIRDLIKTSLRMRPDRIIVGEVRDAACLDMLQALNTGHSGLSTGHANSPKDMLSRLETMVLFGAEIPLQAVRRQIASAIDLIIHLGRLRDRSRRVLEIAEISGYQGEEVVLNPLYIFTEEGEENERIVGTLKSTGKELIRTGKLCAAGLQTICNDTL